MGKSDQIFWPLVVLVLLVLVVLAADPGGETSPSQVQKSGQQITYSLSGNTLVGRSEGEIVWQLMVDKFQVDAQERYVYLTGKIAGVIYRNGQKEYFIQASEGVYDRKSEDFELSGGIEVSTQEGDRLRAQGLVYDCSADEVSLVPPLQIDVDKYRLQADQVVIKSEPERLVAEGNVVINSTSSEEISCDKLIYYREEDAFEIIGKVELVADTGSTSGKE